MFRVSVEKIILIQHRIFGNRKLSTINECGSEIATTSVLICQLSPVGRLMEIENSVSNYFWSTFVDNTGIFDCRLSGVNSLYTVDISAYN